MFVTHAGNFVVVDECRGALQIATVVSLITRASSLLLAQKSLNIGKPHELQESTFDDAVKIWKIRWSIRDLALFIFEP